MERLCGIKGPFVERALGVPFTYDVLVEVKLLGAATALGRDPGSVVSR